MKWVAYTKYAVGLKFEKAKPYLELVAAHQE